MVIPKAIEFAGASLFEKIGKLDRFGYIFERILWNGEKMNLFTKNILIILLLFSQNAFASKGAALKKLYAQALTNHPREKVEHVLNGLGYSIPSIRRSSQNANDVTLMLQRLRKAFDNPTRLLFPFPNKHYSYPSLYHLRVDNSLISSHSQAQTAAGLQIYKRFFFSQLDLSNNNQVDTLLMALKSDFMKNGSVIQYARARVPYGHYVTTFKEVLDNFTSTLTEIRSSLRTSDSVFLPDFYKLPTEHEILASLATASRRHRWNAYDIQTSRAYFKHGDSRAFIELDNVLLEVFRTYKDLITPALLSSRYLSSKHGMDFIAHVLPSIDKSKLLNSKQLIRWWKASNMKDVDVVAKMRAKVNLPWKSKDPLLERFILEEFATNTQRENSAFMRAVFMAANESDDFTKAVNPIINRLQEADRLGGL